MLKAIKPWSGECIIYGQDNQVIITLQLPMSIATMEEENVGVSERLNQPMRAISKTSSCIALNFQRPE